MKRFFYFIFKSPVKWIHSQEAVHLPQQGESRGAAVGSLGPSWWKCSRNSLIGQSLSDRRRARRHQPCLASVEPRMVRLAARSLVTTFRPNFRSAHITCDLHRPTREARVLIHYYYKKQMNSVTHSHGLAI